MLDQVQKRNNYSPVKKAPRPADVAIGTAIRARRLAKGISQEKLAEKIGVTFQQVQKYEKGTNRVGGSRLMQIADALGVKAVSLLPDAGDAVTQAHPHADILEMPDVIELLTAYRDLPKSMKAAAVRMIRAMPE